MRLAIAATTLMLCFGLMSCNDDGDSKPIGASSQAACKCKPDEQQGPRLKPQLTDGGKDRARGWHGGHRHTASGSARWGHGRGRYPMHGRYAMHEHRYPVRGHDRAHRDSWRAHFARHPRHHWHYAERERWRYSSHDYAPRRYEEHESWRYSDHEYAPQPYTYSYVSRSHRSTYDFSDQEQYRGSGGPCCRCHRACAHGGYAGGYRPTMSNNDPAALDPWQGYSDDNGYTDW